MSTDETTKAVREPSEPKYRVRIQATQEVTYEKEVTLEKTWYDRIMAAYNSGSDRELSDEIEGIFDEYDVMDWQPYEYVEIKLLQDSDAATTEGSHD